MADDVATNQFQQNHAEFQEAVKKMESDLPDMMEKGLIDQDVVYQGHTKGMVIEEDDWFVASLWMSVLIVDVVCGLLMDNEPTNLLIIPISPRYI